MKSPCPNRMTLEDLTRSGVHLILGVREGHGFGFLNCPLVVVAGLDGHRLETDIIPPSSDPLFAMELVWEADLKNIRRLRQANTPVKIECFSVVNPQKRERIGYILLSLKQAQIVPHGKKVNIVESWHRLLGVRSEMKALNPEMLLTLRIEDSPDETSLPVKIDPLLDIVKHDLPITNTLTPLLFADEDVIQIGSQDYCVDIFKLKINIGLSCNIKLLLPNIKSFFKQLQVSENLNNFILAYSIMGYSVHNEISINELKDKDKDAVISCDSGTVINVRSNLKVLRTYFNEFPLLVFKLIMNDIELATTSLQLKTLVLTDNLLQFRKEKGSFLDTRCYLTPSSSIEIGSVKPFIDVSVKLTHDTSHHGGGFGDSKIFGGEVPKLFKTQGHGDTTGTENSTVIETILSPRKRIHQNVTSAPVNSSVVPSIPVMDFEKVIATSRQSQSLPNSPKSKFVINNNINKNRQGSCTYRCSNEYTTMAPHSFVLRVILNSVIFKKLPPDKKFTFSMHHPVAEVVCSEHRKVSAECINEKICLRSIEAQFRFTSHPDEINITLNAEQPVVSVCDVNNKVFASAVLHTGILLSSQKNKECVYTASLESDNEGSSIDKKQQLGLLNVTMSLIDCGIIIKSAVSQEIGDATSGIDKRVAYRVVEELEDWKERQQELFKNELKKKECQHLTMLSSEWTKRRMELEDNLNRNVEQCRTLAQSLNEATDNMRERSRKNSEKERALALAEKELERKYEMKFQELKEATNRMEADINHKLSLMKFEKTELLEKIGQIEREKKRLLRNVQNLETELNTTRATGLSKEQAASLLQEMKSLEEKLEAALESKMFFKEQWGKAVREIHRLKKDHQLTIQAQLQRERDELYKIQLGNQAKEEEKQMIHDKNILQDLKFQTQEISGQQYNLKQPFKTQQPIKSTLVHPTSEFRTTSPPRLDLNNTQLQRLIDQRDQLLNSGAVTNREMLAALNSQIRTLLLQMSA